MKKVLALLLISFFVLQLIAAPNVYAASLPFTALGQVVDRHGKAVQGATVILYDGIYKEISRTTTDENGAFGFANVVANNPNCKVKIEFKDGQTTYQTDVVNTLWYGTDTGIVKFDVKDTTLDKYPPPEYGYLWGAMQQDGSSGRSLGNGVVYASSGDQKFYAFTDNSKNRGTFIMRLPVGHYKVWGQYMENGMIFQSSKIMDVDVTGASNYLDVISTTVLVPLSAAASNPQPAEMPTQDQLNIVSGYVTYKDGKPIVDQPVTLYQVTDDGMSGYLKVGEARTDPNGFYQFYGVQVTADAPDNGVVYGSKSFNITVAFTDPNGQKYLDSRKITLYNPNFVTLDKTADQRARNPVANFTVPYSTQGWVKINTVNPEITGIKLYIDDKLITDSDGKPVTLPYTAYLEPKRHYVKITAPGYDEWKTPVDIVENTPTQDIFVGMTKSAVPSWVPVAAAVVIIILVVLAILALLFTKRQMIMGMFGGIIVPIQGALGKSLNNYKASSQARKANKAQMAEVRKAEQAKMAQAREAAAASRAKLDSKKSQEKAFNARAEQPRLPEYRGEEEEAPSMVSARDIYKKQDRSSVEKISSSHASRGPSMIPPAAYDEPAPRAPAYEARESRESRAPPAYETRAPIASEPDGRIRVPKSMPIGRDQPPSTSIKDKEKVIRYIREHQDGVSFIQMSNDLEIPPNTLTMITKELVINDDIEKVKGLYYYKSHDSSSDRESSVVVWRLDGEE
ncbi:carboxypeptidase-like regulatory domain-containing protein [Methanocella sp. MCL-LM]|uniref:carboxypeptidase-like regulatory domain-containing protein n=1 Tax=Methanocella sp. MCL-LM TaxID=3412035 RepID=UPI003C770B3B